jgi:hypothetical protein
MVNRNTRQKHPLVLAKTPQAGDREAVESMLAAANGKAGTFTTNSFSRVRDIAAEAEVAMQSAGIPQAERAGTTVVHINAGPASKAYKRCAIATRIRLVRDSKGNWRLTLAERATVWPCDGETFGITINPTAAETVKRKALARFNVAEG